MAPVKRLERTTPLTLTAVRHEQEEALKQATTLSNNLTKVQSLSRACSRLSPPYTLRAVHHRHRDVRENNVVFFAHQLVKPLRAVARELHLMLPEEMAHHLSDGGRVIHDEARASRAALVSIGRVAFISFAFCCAGVHFGRELHLGEHKTRLIHTRVQ